jgi:PAT family beta-lactamase induction signal transducer AmpG
LASVQAAESQAVIKKKRSMMEVLRSLRKPKMSAMLALGFSSGLPFMLFGNTLGFWLADGKVALATIGFMSWTGTVFLIKFVWGALVDHVPPPLLHRLGQRRGWMILTQLIAAAGLVGMALSGPQHIYALAAFAVLTALGGAMQDTVIDAWRIEIADNPDELGMLTASYTLGYRVALFATEALILVIADKIGWPAAYGIFAGLMAVGMAGALFGREPARTLERRAVVTGLGNILHAVWDAVIEPFITFFKAHGVALACLTLGLITLYHLSDYMRGPMSGPFYKSLAIDKPTIAWVRGAIGVPMTIIGVAVGGVASVRFGNRATLVMGAILQPIGIGAFAILAAHGSDFVAVSLGGLKVTAFELIMAFDAFAIAFSGLALIGFMSTLTRIGYTATQYALLSSAMAWSGKFLKGFSGEIVQSLENAGHTPVDAFRLFYLGVAAIGLPALILCVVLANWPAPAARPETR